jgi:hypothetical protein
VEAFTPAGSESYTETQGRPLLHINQQPLALEKSIKINRENTGPQQNTTNKIWYAHPPENYEKENHDHINNL